MNSLIIEKINKQIIEATKKLDIIPSNEQIAFATVCLMMTLNTEGEVTSEWKG